MGQFPIPPYRKVGYSDRYRIGTRLVPSRSVAMRSTAFTGENGVVPNGGEAYHPQILAIP